MIIYWSRYYLLDIIVIIILNNKTNNLLFYIKIIIWLRSLYEFHRKYISIYTRALCLLQIIKIYMKFIYIIFYYCDLVEIINRTLLLSNDYLVLFHKLLYDFLTLKHDFRVKEFCLIRTELKICFIWKT